MRGAPVAQTRNPLPRGAYVAEIAGTFFMIAWGLYSVVFTMSPTPPVPALIPDYRIRLLATGILFASGGTLVIYSPLGQRSGGHLDPAVSLTFRMPGQIETRDLILYSAAQSLGEVGGAKGSRKEEVP